MAEAAAPINPAVIRNLALVRPPTVVLRYLIAAAGFLSYRVSQASCEANLVQLADAGDAHPLLPGV